MRGEPRVQGEAAGTNVRLECGHCVELPWDLAPEAAVADVLQHRASCSAGAMQLFDGGFAVAEFVRPVEGRP